MLNTATVSLEPGFSSSKPEPWREASSEGTAPFSFSGFLCPVGAGLGDFTYFPVFQGDMGAAASLNGLIITKGCAPDDKGGGIFNQINGTLAIDDCTIRAFSPTAASYRSVPMGPLPVFTTAAN
jgi:hypothetical protein